MMRVTLEEIDTIAVEKMAVAECEDHHAGECVGYRCQHCAQADESLDQIWHQDDCPLAGEHGRQHYESLEQTDTAAPTAELRPENPIWVVEAAETDVADDVYNGTVLAFKCRCGNADEDLMEIIHDESCALADDDCDLGRTDADLILNGRAIADGGDPAN